MSSQYISGFHAIEEHLKSGRGAATLLVGPRPGPRVKAILEQAKKRGIRTRNVETAELDRVSDGADHRGVLLHIEGIVASRNVETTDLKTSLDRLAASSTERRSRIPQSQARNLILALDSITDPHNLGAILRSADQFGVDLVLVPERRAAHENETVMRSSAGASAHVKTIVVGNLTRALEQCREAGYWVAGADMSGTRTDSFDAKRDLVIVLGSEGKGMGRLVRESCDEVLSIPARGNVDSLNVSVAAGILLYEARRQQGFSWS